MRDGWGSVLVLAAFLAASFAAAAIGAAFPPGEWYQQIAKPDWTPPPWLFGPVWTVLYVLIGVSGWWIFKHAAPPWRGRLLALWAAQMVFNAAWSWLFFGLRSPGLALVDIAMLLALVLALVVLSWPRLRPVSWMLLPYALWVGFAGVLNASIWWLNR
ncbi:MAG: TspO/MBR family protein [Lysobacteraceae bacterium]